MHKVGDIYDAVFFVIKHHTEHDKLTTRGSKSLNLWWYKLGSYYGIIFKLFFYTESEPDPQDPAKHLKWESGFWLYNVIFKINFYSNPTVSY